MTVVLLPMLLSMTARAEVGLTGMSGTLSTPTADTLPQGESAGTVTSSTSYSGGRLRGSALPLGFGVGMSPNMELGATMTIDGPYFEGPTKEATGFTLGARRRLLLPTERRPAVTLAGTVGDPLLNPSVGLAVVSTGRHDLAVLSFGLGGHAYQALPPDAEVFGSVDLLLDEASRLLLDGQVVVDKYGPRRLDGRLGYRRALNDHFVVTAWTGVGARDLEPWLGGGAAVALYSSDPRRVDRDQDGAADWYDRCPLAPEDADGWEDDDGCPDLDNDGDGIPDAEDPTPNGSEAEEEPQFRTPTPELRMRIKERRLPGDEQ